MRLRLKHDRLLEFLAQSELSQNHWAIRVGLSRGHWSEIVNGKHPFPSPKTRARIVEALGLPQEELFALELGGEPWADLDFRRAIMERYVIDAEIGQGGMGAVHLARDVRHGRVVAVKVIAAEAVSEIGLSQFHREIGTVSRLQHPNILPLFDSGEAAGQPFYVTPFVRGGSLRARLRSEGSLGLREALPLVRGIAAGLDHAHGERVLHCDVKPENVLLHDEHAWVMDFGIARKLHGEGGRFRFRSSVDVSAGTPAYVSPEQASGDPDLDPRSDVYSLGCMVFELLSGRPPFDGTTTREIISRRFLAPPPPLCDLVPGVPAAVADVVARAMALRPADRQESTRVFARELDAAVATGSRTVLAVGATVTRAARVLTRGLRVPAPNLGGAVRNLGKDLEHAVRGLRRNAAFTATVVLTLGLAVGANATMFGVVDRILLQAPPHIQDPDRLVRVHVSRWFDGHRPPTPSFTFPSFTDLRDGTRSLESVAALEEITLSSGVGAEARALRAQLVTGRYFEMLGVRPVLGRLFGEEEARLPQGEAVAVLSYAFWQSSYGGDMSVLGRTLTLAGLPHSIIGVAPRGFSGTQLTPVDLWAPMAGTLTAAVGSADWVTARGWQFLRVFARLRDGVGPEAANTDVTRAYQLGNQDAGEYERRAVTSLVPIIPGKDPSTAGLEGRVSTWLFGMAAIVLLIACANVANLVLARGLSRQGEIAVRRALGVGRLRLLRQFALESAALAVLGALAGVAVAYAGQGLVRRVLLVDMAWSQSPLGGRVLGFTVLLALAAVVLAAFFPLLRATSTNLVAALHGAGRGQVGAPRRVLMGLLLVQTALSTILLIAAGLFLQSLRRVHGLDLGFRPDGMVYAVPSAPAGATNDEMTLIMQQSVERVRMLPAVRAAGLTIGAPFMGNYATSLRAPGIDSIPRLPGGGPYYFRVGAGGMEALGVRLLRGRLIEPADDRPGAAPAVVITERMASALWPGRNPLEQCLIVSGRPCAPVVGVVADLHRQGLREAEFMMYFVPLHAFAEGDPPAEILIRVSGHPEASVESIRRELLAVRGDMPYIQVETYESLIAPQAKSWRLGATMFTAFAVLSLIMAGVGIYGVLAFTVRRRMAELGVRSALGARPWTIRWTIVRSGGLAAIAGALIGVVGALLLAGWLEPLLFGTSAREPAILLAGALCVVVFGVGAALRPAATASRADPLQALRAE